VSNPQKERRAFDRPPLSGPGGRSPQLSFLRRLDRSSGAFFESEPRRMGNGRGSGLTTGELGGHSPLAQHRL